MFLKKLGFKNAIKKKSINTREIRKEIFNDKNKKKIIEKYLHTEVRKNRDTFLKKHKNVGRVIYPTLHEGEIAARSKKYLKGGNGALVGVELKGGVESGKKFIESLKMFYHVANIGDARSLAIHPATTTHSQLTEEELLAAGVTPGYVRLSIGIEHSDDIIADLDQALNQSGKPNLKAVG